VTWHLKKAWSGTTASPSPRRLLFTWEYVATPRRPHQYRSYKDVKVDKVDSHTIRLSFSDHAVLADAFCGVRGMVIPKHLFEAFKGGKSREAPNNLKPVGTGRTSSWTSSRRHGARELNRPTTCQSSVLRHHRDEGRRDAVWPPGPSSRRRGRLRLEHAGRGRDLEAHGAGGKAKRTSPRAQHRAHPAQQHRSWKEVDGERSSLKTKHPS